MEHEQMTLFVYDTACGMYVCIVYMCVYVCIVYVRVYICSVYVRMYVCLCVYTER